MGVDVSVDDFKNVVQPDLTVILTLSHAVQMERLKKRGMTIGDERAIHMQQEVATAFYNNALEFNIAFITIDTKFSPCSCADIIVAAAKAIRQ